MRLPRSRTGTHVPFKQHMTFVSSLLLINACYFVDSTDLNDSGIERSVAEADMTGDEDDDEWEDLDEEEEDEDPEQTILTSHHPQIYCYEECIGWTPDRGVKRSQTVSSSSLAFLTLRALMSTAVGILCFY